MCGIAGFISSESETDASLVESVRRMTDRMRRRGPDAEAIWNGFPAILAHRRLAIVDLDTRSNQPMHWAAAGLSIVFNGEIYNYRQLRAELESAGDVFQTTSDTEVLLALYARYGEAMLSRLRGMFAFAIWDARTRELFLARDPYGIKPLYYARTSRGFAFASQVKAILASGLFSSDPEPAGLAGFHLWGTVPEPWTLYRGIYALPCGAWMLVRNGVASPPVVWNDIRENWRLPQARLSAEELQSAVREALLGSVRDHLVSDVPISLFLSGGIDSSAIAGMVTQLGFPLEGITVGFSEFSSRHEDEAPIAAQVARHYGLPHHIRSISHAEFEADLPTILDAMDQPSIDGINTWFAAKASAERGYKVVLSGIGGDELFYGYNLMRELPVIARRGRLLASIPGSRSLARIATSVFGPNRHPKMKGLPHFMDSLEGLYFLKRGLFLPEELPFVMDPALAREGLSRLGGDPPSVRPARAINDAAGVCLLDSVHYLRNQLLRDSDWASMAHSLELRTPLVDATLLNTLSPVHSAFTNGAGKRLLAHTPEIPLPASIVNRPKSGFTIPMTEWLAARTAQHSWSGTPLLSAPGTPWTRRWARIVLEEGFKIESSLLSDENSSLHSVGRSSYGWSG
ncbi:MAG TPA: asparagine synthase (glutamine-hydrolyzing) [Acidobacteriaceae bacterium]|nr:asparagine synthase (glutamine-hydrolyzing) [Acidobacteriaceae bacterium]